MIDAFLAVIAPHICSGCSEYGSPLCDSCMNDIVSEDFGRCVWCLKPTADMHQCKACTQATGVTATWAIGERTEVLKRLLNDYKFEARREAANALASLLDMTLPTLPTETVISWVPTAPAHIRERGFDHAAKLARAFAVRRGLIAQPLLTRRHGGSQHILNRSARAEAAEQAFGVMGDTAPPVVLLIDDVLTTGATMRACTKLLKNNGANIYAAVVARQPL